MAYAETKLLELSGPTLSKTGVVWKCIGVSPWAPTDAKLPLCETKYQGSRHYLYLVRFKTDLMKSSQLKYRSIHEGST